MACGGNDYELCGGPNRMNIFHNDAITVTPKGPATNAGPTGWGFMGCYTDNVGARTLTTGGQSAGGGGALTVALCTQACQSQGFNTSGVEYSGECYCGNGFSNGGALAPDGLTGCNMVCNGNSSEFCGGPNRLNVYGLGVKSTIAPNWALVGCYSDTTQARTLSHGVPTLGGGQNMTNPNCQSACLAAGYTIAGTEYSGECYCDTAYSNGGGPASDGNAQCSMACNGDPTDICGGPDRLTVYKYIGDAAPTTPTNPGNPNPPPAQPPANNPTFVPSMPTDVPPGWKYSGCYVDNKYGRILYQQPDIVNMTIESCIATCTKQGLPVAGMEYSAQCFCGNYMLNGGALASADSQCGMTCAGNNTQACGGPDRMSVWSNITFQSYAPPKPQTTGLPGNFQYQGCLTDTPQPRILPYEVQDFQTNLSVPLCLQRCMDFGFSAASVEYGTQCYCGDDIDRQAKGVPYLNEQQCNTACIGDPTAMCGGAGAMNYYTSPGLVTWTNATGDAAGEYKFLIGGVVVPLITTMGRNGKVTFTEKHGTGPPNSTGGYELDLSAINNFSQAWRELDGLKTDVFCSAGLTLPDKKARQINVGGWSADSLFGVRLFTPDGSPGVPSVGDWQENSGEVHLQTGRWYPSMMQMVNGSLLVVGGEDGSNGKPVPNLEILPRPAGGILQFCQWLQDTDPWNLYPFMAVLPSGDIFVQYYNQALILDEVTLAVKRKLPQVPGAVNNPLAGRTYPLEGSMMLLPQKYPYTDPLQILICGGSTPYGGFALDNCVSITPEVPGAQWVIERMPSKRVIPSMVALPDGTMLIMNGAHQGVAGFELASDPNLQAMMYDPAKPFNSRITSLASTTIARMYHNEAILLQDGRVLVSGSDPQDNALQRYPQEYRVEVFIPPYIHALNEPLVLNTSQPLGPNATIPTNASTNAAPSAGPYANVTASAANSTTNGTANCSGTKRPVFTLNTQGNPDPDYDVSYGFGATISITMWCGTASKISLMGAVSTTHGNSMGQRTIFPQFSCSGNQCTITTPPNAHITGGPNWFMMFVLDANNVPSYAHWVRIGGDPAGLGSWPNFGDFTLPGV